MFSKRLAICVCSVVSCLLISGCTVAELERVEKSFVADMTGGLERTVTVYSNTGEKIQSWTGKFSVTNSETEVYFDVDGKRVIIHGGIVINEELLDQE